MTPPAAGTPRHAPARAAEYPHAGHGQVVLDIGGDIGALIVHAPPTLAGREIEICPAGHRHHAPDDGAGWWHGDWHAHHRGHTTAPAWPHVSVLPRRAGRRVPYAAVFPGLHDGQYELWLRPHGPTTLTAHVTGGRITHLDWPHPATTPVQKGATR